MRTAGLTMAAAGFALGAFALAPSAAEAAEMIVPASSPFSLVDAFFGGVLFGGGSLPNGFPGPATGPYPEPSVGCYFTRVRVNNAWKRVQVCY